MTSAIASRRRDTTRTIPAFRHDFEAQCRRTKAAGVDAIEIHQSVFEKTMNGDLDHAAIDRAQDGYLAELGMTVTACNINTWTNPEVPARRALQSGSGAAPGGARRDPEGRRDLQAAEDSGPERVARLRRRGLSLSDRLHAVARVVHRGARHGQHGVPQAGIKLAIEPKPYEPRELYMIIPTAASAILVAQRVNRACGGNNCGLTIDYGHQKMEATTASTSCDLAAYAGVPVHKFDINDARQGRNDQDLMFGTVSIPESVEYLYTTFVRDYRGYYSQDQFTYREDPTRAIERSMINFANLSLKAVRVLADQPRLDGARAPGTGPDVLDVVSPVLVGCRTALQDDHAGPPWKLTRRDRRRLRHQLRARDRRRSVVTAA